MESTAFMTIDFELVPAVFEVFHLFKNIGPVLQLTCTDTGVDLVSMSSGLTSMAFMHTTSHYKAKTEGIADKAHAANTVGVSSSALFNAFKELKGKTVRVQLDDAECSGRCIQILDSHACQLCKLPVFKLTKAYNLPTVRDCDLTCILPTYTLHDLTRQAVRKQQSVEAAQGDCADLIKVEFRETASAEHPYKILLNEGDMYINLPSSTVKIYRRSKIGSSLDGRYNASHFLGSTRPICNAVVLHVTQGDYPLVFEYTLPDTSLLHIALCKMK
jgi:hypothetical protein